MNPRIASVLAALVLALAVFVPALPSGGATAAPVLCPAAQAPAAAWDPFAVTQAAASCKQQECDALCAPLQGRCKAGSCFCLRDPL